VHEIFVARPYGAGGSLLSAPPQSGMVAIEEFVREALGCTCPDEVFRSVRICHPGAAFAGLSPGYLVEIGGRLLVLVIETDHWEALSPPLEILVAQGRRLRDAGGFNRFRLVIATPEVTTARAVLARRFTALPDRDERLHLHVLSPADLPQRAPGN
jgi:hypothetical protein